MQYTTLIRKKDNSYQYVITYKLDNQWKTKSKQGFPLNKAGKEKTQQEMDRTVLELKRQLNNFVDVSMIGITYGAFTKKYTEHMKLYREMNTILAIQSALNHFVRLDNIELTKVSLLDIQEIVDDMTRTGISSNTIKDYIRKLNTIFLSARNEYNLITNLPTKNIITKINKDNIINNKRALNKSESDKLLKDFKEGKHSKYYLIILIALTCGLRIGEIIGLTWDNVDIKNSVLKITKQWKQISETDKSKYGFGTLKSKNSYREVPIPSKTLLALKEYKEISYHEVSGKVVPLKKTKCADNIGNRLFSFRNTDSTSICLNRLFRLGKYNITIHELRHTYATTLISNGIDFKTAAKFLGHTVQQTMKTYSHVNDDMIKRAKGIIENIF